MRIPGWPGAGEPKSLAMDFGRPKSLPVKDKALSEAPGPAGQAMFHLLETGA
jgi:hypothetical protein